MEPFHQIDFGFPDFLTGRNKIKSPMTATPPAIWTRRVPGIRTSLKGKYGITGPGKSHGLNHKKLYAARMNPTKKNMIPVSREREV